MCHEIWKNVISQGSYQQAVLHTWQDYGGNLWDQEAEVLRDVEAFEGAPDQPQQVATAMLHQYMHFISMN